MKAALLVCGFLLLCHAWAAPATLQEQGEALLANYKATNCVFGGTDFSPLTLAAGATDYTYSSSDNHYTWYAPTPMQRITRPCGCIDAAMRSAQCRLWIFLGMLVIGPRTDPCARIWSPCVCVRGPQVCQHLRQYHRTMPGRRQAKPGRVELRFSAAVRLLQPGRRLDGHVEHGGHPAHAGAVLHRRRRVLQCAAGVDLHVAGSATALPSFTSGVSLLSCFFSCDPCTRFVMPRVHTVRVRHALVGMCLVQIQFQYDPVKTGLLSVANGATQCDFVAIFATKLAGGGGGKGGWIFVLIVVIGFPVYFAIGYVYNWKVAGKEAGDRLPQGAFWADLPSLVKDGCAYFLYLNKLLLSKCVIASHRCGMFLLILIWSVSV